MIRQGTVYRLEGGSPDLYGVLVLTNDVWNRRMATVGVVPVRARRDPETIWTPSFGNPPLQVSVGFLASLPGRLFQEIRLVLDADERGKVARSLADLLAIEALCADPPAAPPAVAGAGRFPRWGQIYYAGPRVGQSMQTKRYVVVSDERWNALGRGAIAVRTTTQQKSWGEAFPSIEGGLARACCGDATVIPANQFDFHGRPQPGALSLDDMVAIARGLSDVFDLDPSEST